MLIVCPKCGAEGNIKHEVPVGKKLRCKKCRHIFTPRPVHETKEMVDPFSTDPSLYNRDRDTNTVYYDTQNRQTEEDETANIDYDADNQTPRLVVVMGKDKGKTFELTKFQTIIGRRNADIILNDAMISRQHAAIEIFDNQLLLKDLGSSNGIYFNGKKVKIAIMSNGDKIQLGETLLEYMK